MVSNIDSILGKLSIDKETFVKAMQSEEEIEIEFSTPSTEFSPDSFAEDDNFLTYQRNFAEEQKTAGKEMAIKEARNKYGLDFQGKTMEGLSVDIRGSRRKRKASRLQSCQPRRPSRNRRFRFAKRCGNCVGVSMQLGRDFCVPQG